MGYEPKRSPEKSHVAAVMMLLAHVGPINSSAVAPGRRRRTPWTRPASAAGSWDHGVVWLSRQWRRMPWLVVACHGLSRVKYYACDRAIARIIFLSDINYGNLRSNFAATIPTLLVLQLIYYLPFCVIYRNLSFNP